MDTVEVREAAELAGIPYGTVTRWIRGGLLQDTRPKGKRAQRVPIPFTKKEVRELCILAQLRERFSLQELRKALKFLRGLGHNPLSTGRFLVIKGPPGKQQLIKLCDKKTAVATIGRTAGQLTLFPLEIEGDVISYGD